MPDHGIETDSVAVAAELTAVIVAVTDGQPRVLDPPAEHAVADVEEHPEAERHALVGELRDGLRHAVLVHLERLTGQSLDEVALLVEDGRRDAGDLDAALK